jgi:hypothetical protein
MASSTGTWLVNASLELHEVTEVLHFHILFSTVEEARMSTLMVGTQQVGERCMATKNHMRLAFLVDHILLASTY